MKSKFKQYKVENGIPVPEQPNRRSFLRSLKAGQSFVSDIKQRSSWNDAIFRVKRAVKGSDFATRKISTTKVRIWRIS